MKCILCGKNATSGHLCKECFQKSHSAVEGFMPFALSCCKLCGKYAWNERWFEAPNVNDALKKAFLENTKFLHTPDSLEIIIPPSEQRQAQMASKPIVTLNLISTIEGIVCEESYEVPVKIQYPICPKCSLKNTPYFEGILQLRNTAYRQFRDVVTFIQEEALGKQDKGIFITRQEDVPGGVDFYITSQKYIQQVAQLVLSKFGGTLKVNPQIFTRDRQTSKDVYRINVLVKLPLFNEGDILKIKEQVVLVRGMSGKLLQGVDLRSHKTVRVQYDEKHEILAKHDEIRETVVTKESPRLEVLHPETYQSVPVQNPIPLFSSKTAKVVVIDEKVWLVE